jgi:hypothetical protein
MNRKMPVIKSMTRKDASFGQLVGYLHKEEPTFRQLLGYINKETAESNHVQTLLHNIPGIDPDDFDGITQAFKDNDAFRSQRKNGVVQYHEIISFSPADRDILARDPGILMDMARKYLDLRAPHSLAIARPHFDGEHIHVHLMISGNQSQSKETSRISRMVFDQVKKELNEYQLSQYPELSNSVIKEHLTPKKSPPVKEELKEKSVIESNATQEEISPLQLTSGAAELTLDIDHTDELVFEMEDMAIPSPYWNVDDSPEEPILSPYWDADENDLIEFE